MPVKNNAEAKKPTVAAPEEKPETTLPENAPKFENPSSPPAPPPAPEEVEAPEPSAIPGFYVDNGPLNGPYLTAADAEWARDQVFGGEGHIVEIPG